MRGERRARGPIGCGGTAPLVARGRARPSARPPARRRGSGLGARRPPSRPRGAWRRRAAGADPAGPGQGDAVAGAVSRGAEGRGRTGAGAEGEGGGLGPERVLRPRAPPRRRPPWRAEGRGAAAAQPAPAACARASAPAPGVLVAGSPCPPRASVSPVREPRFECPNGREAVSPGGDRRLAVSPDAAALGGAESWSAARGLQRQSNNK